MKTYAKIRFYWGAFVISFIVAVFMIPLITVFRSKKGLIMHKLNKAILFLMGGKLEQVGEVIEGVLELGGPDEYECSPLGGGEVVEEPVGSGQGEGVRDTWFLHLLGFNQIVSRFQIAWNGFLLDQNFIGTGSSIIEIR